MSLKQYINNWQQAPLNQLRKQPKRRQHPDEESLFNAMIDYFHVKKNASVIINPRKTHGRKNQVSYTPIPPYYNVPGWGTNVSKEISDVFFMVYSPQMGIARMTHLQAKYEKNRGINPQANNFVFKLDDGQFLMMHNRLPLTRAGLFPKDIFSFPLFSDSIASYGVFYSDLNGDFNMAYEVASLISYPGDAPYTTRKSIDEHSFATTSDLWGYCNIMVPPMDIMQRICHRCEICWDYCCEHMPELLSTVSVETFERELLELRVGTRVDFDITTLQTIAQLFEDEQFTSFVDEQAQWMDRWGILERIENFRRDQNGNEPPRENVQNINPEEMGGAYILINADEVEREQ